MINMQELQIKQKDDEFSLELLQKGHAVTSYEVNKMINAFFDTKTPGLPYFNPTRLTRYSTSDKDVYNDMFKTLKEDLNNAYIIYNNQTDYGVIINGDYDMRMETANKAIDNLVMQTEILEDYTKKKIAYTPYIINFNDLTDVNTKNLVVNNIPYTTSEIDFNTSTLRNELQSLPNDKLDLSAASVKIESSNAEVKLDKDASVIFSELLNNALTVTTKTSSQNPNSLTISIDLAEEKDISRIDLSGYSVYNTNVSLYLSEDGANFFEKSTTKGDPNLVWRFNQTTIKSIKIVINKTSFDYRKDDDSDGYCYFMISNLSLYLDKYKKTSVFTSKTIEMEEVISNVTLSPVHEVPPNTDIKYYIGYENKNNNIEWKSISPDSQLDLGLLYKEEMILNYQVTDITTFGPRRYDKANKSFYFRIHTLPVDTNLNSIELRAGHSQWLIESLDCTDKYPNTTMEVYDANTDTFYSNKPAPGIPSDFKCHTNDYAKGRVTAIAPLDSTMMEIRPELVNNYFVMSQYAICDKDVIIENRYVDFDIDKITTKDTTKDSETHNHLGVIKTLEVEKFDVMVLINGKQIFPKDGKYTFRLKKGENLVQLMMLIANQQALNPDGTPKDYVKLVKHNFNLISYTKALFAGPPMQRINYNALLKNIDEKSLKYYAIKRENLKTVGDSAAPDNFEDVIVTKFDPNYIIKPFDPQMYDVDATPTAMTTLERKMKVAASSVPTTIHFNDRDYEPQFDENNDVIIPVEGDTSYPEYKQADVHLNNTNYMRMYIKFKHMLPSVKANITNSDGNSNVRLRVMAKLSTGDVTVSPAIKAIKIVGE